MATSQTSRDWLRTLWPASFKGVPFYFEQDKEEGGRGLVVHSFPNRDDPFVEDLGEEPRVYSGSAYVHGDSADALATALKAALASRGAGMLVVPYFGPVTVHCQSFERATQRDQMGYVAFELKFVRKGAASGLVSVPLLQNVGFVAADVLASVLAQSFPATITTAGKAAVVVAAVTDTLSEGAAALDVIRQSYPVDPKVSAVVRDAVPLVVGSFATSITNDAVPGAAAIAAVASLIALVRQTVDAMPAVSAVRAALELAASFPSVSVSGAAYLTPTQKLAAENAAAASRAVRLAAVIAYAEAILRTSFAARPDGVTARGEVAERFETEFYQTDGAENAALFVAIEALRDRVIDWLTRTIANLAPVITVESNRQRPSLDLAWILYADPTRADELVVRNAVRNPFLMPREITALSR
ncbi:MULTISPECIES: DNA circularization N-terminal domain-containing protein [unclassified Bradyrhizobium]|uniref:DNA circularization N-terminal domain-containing protein n=1 Tax=unclassified Bradyrhizobium TaxID=2631580 RepID=UPI002916C7DD|nr:MULTISPECIES: DNA circularization N-terminal domain-containing protein [unclassified Bradyrhizobium]